MIKIDPLDAMTTGPAGFDKTGDHPLLHRQPRARTRRPFSRRLSATGETTLIAEDPRADIGGVLAHPTEKTMQAVAFTYARDRVEDARRGDPARPRLL